MVEIAIALTIIALMVAVLVPALTNRIRQAQVTTLRTTLDNVLSGIINYQLNMTRYPQRLQQLAFVPDVNRPYDSCVNSILGLTANWRGPYVSQQIDTSDAGDLTSARGLPIGDYVANDLLVRGPAVSSTPGRLEVVIPAMDPADWLALNDIVDGTSGNVPPLSAAGDDTAGTVRWSSSVTTLKYGLQIHGC